MRRHKRYRKSLAGARADASLGGVYRKCTRYCVTPVYKMHPLFCPRALALLYLLLKIPSCKFFGDGTGQSMKTHARVDFPHIRQANTQEV